MRAHKLIPINNLSIDLVSLEIIFESAYIPFIRNLKIGIAFLYYCIQLVTSLVAVLFQMGSFLPSSRFQSKTFV